MPEQLSETAGGPRSALSERVRSLRLDHDQRAPRRRTGLPWFLAALFGAATAYLLPREFLRASAPAAVESAVAPVAGIADPAATKPAAGPPGQPSDKVLESKGYLIAKQLILITPKVAGRIEQLFVDEGKVVRKGDTLAILERDEYQFERDASQARLDEANAKLTEWTNGYQEEEVALVAADRSEADSLLKKAEAEFRRMQELRESRNAAPTDYEAAEAAYLAAKARLQRLKGSDAILLRRTPAKVAAIRAAAAQAKADLERTQFRLDNCVVKSPVDGIVLSKKAEEGNVVNPIAFAIMLNS